jgi:hypothetical protein
MPAQAGPEASGRPGGPPVPARLRPLTDHGHGPWLSGTLRLTPGSLLWVPDMEDDGSPVELASAVLVSSHGRGLARLTGRSNVIQLDTQAGRVELEMRADLFTMSQDLVRQASA